MKQALVALSLLLLLSACAPKVLFVKETEVYTAVFTDAKCSNEQIMSEVKAQGEMAKLMGLDKQVIDKVEKSFKEGKVHFKKTGEDRQFCFTEEEQIPGNVFVIDSQMNQFSTPKVAPKND